MAVTVTCYIDGEKITTSGLYKWSRVANFADRISIVDGKAAFNGKIMYYNGVAVSESDYSISGAQYTTTPPASDTGQPAYIGIGGVARQVKAIYIGVDGVARKVKKAYIGVDGVARLCYTADASGGGNSVTLINFSVNKAGSFQAEEGMTWEQFVNSAYNTGGFGIAKKFVTTSDGLFLTVSPEILSYISINEIIIADHQYGADY